MKRPAFWILLGLISLAATAAAVHYFPQAFSIVALDITMDRERALARRARDCRARPARARRTTGRRRRSRSTSEAQTFVELEGGGKEAFTRMLRERSLLRLHLARPALQGRRNQRDARSASRPTAGRTDSSRR